MEQSNLLVQVNFYNYGWNCSIIYAYSLCVRLRRWWFSSLEIVVYRSNYIHTYPFSINFKVGFDNCPPTAANCIWLCLYISRSFFFCFYTLVIKEYAQRDIYIPNPWLISHDHTSHIRAFFFFFGYIHWDFSGEYKKIYNKLFVFISDTNKAIYMHSMI